MSTRLACAFALALVATVAGPVAAAPTRSSPLGVAADGHVFVVNPDASTVSRLEFSLMHVGTLTHEQPVGTYPRTLALDATHVFTADQKSDTVSRRDQADLGNLVQANLGPGCNPYGVAATPAGDKVVVSCQGSSELVILDPGLATIARVALPWPNARAIAVTSDGSKAYVTHFLSEEPDNNAHVSVVDLGNKSVLQVFAVAPDTTTCETQNSGQGPLNLVSAIALMPDGAPAEVAGQVWIGGTQENNLSKGLFKREASFKAQAGAGLFPWLTYKAFPQGGVNRDVYKASFHDITRFGIYKLDATSGAVVGKLDFDEANHGTDIEFSADGAVAYVVDLMFNSYHILNTKKGQGLTLPDGSKDVTTLYAPPSAFGPGGGDDTKSCVPDALRPITAEGPFRLAPQSQLVTIDSYEPVDASNTVVRTGVDFNGKLYFDTGVSAMRAVADGVGTAPIGVRLSPDGETVYVANYLARNVVPMASATPLDGSGNPANLRCVKNPALPSCSTNNDCPAATGFCNHPGGATCTSDADCGGNPPCIRGGDCVPLVLGQPVYSTASNPITGTDTVPAGVLDGKILFNTAARDASVPNGVGLGTAAPRFDDASDPENQQAPGSVVSTSHDASYVTCSTCHADFGGQDGRTWDFSQFGASLRNTMDLRGRPGFSPGTCSNNAAQTCFFDATCGDGNFCKANPSMIPPNVAPADRDRWFNPMETVHWNGDRDEVEDFEHTFRSLQGSGDCDAAEDLNTCEGALIQRSPATSTDPADVNADLGPPNRNIRGPVSGKIVGIRLTHMADFVYSLTDFVENPNAATDASQRGGQIFNDPQTQCASCHNGGPAPGQQFFTDKKPNPGFDPGQAGAADHNNPFIRHDVGTGNLFDAMNPLTIAQQNGIFQNPRVPIPGARGNLGDYVTPVLVDLWNTAPYLHDGSAHTLLDVVRPCDPTLDDCLEAGRGRNLKDQHGVTSILTPQQLNDLVAFQRTLTLGTTVGTNLRVVSAGALDLSRAQVKFPKQPRKGHAASGKGSFAVSGVLRGAPTAVDPTGGVVFTIATPAGEQMAILSRTLTVKGKKKSFTGRSTTGGGVVMVKLKAASGGTFKFTAVGKGLDLSALNTGNPDVTVAVEVSGVQFVRNRNLALKRNVFKLSRRNP